MTGTIRVLNEMKSAGGVDDYAVAGAIGAIYYTEPTATNDLDALVAFAGGS